MNFDVGDIVVMETLEEPLPELFIVWRVVDASDRARLSAEVVGNDLVREAALEKAVKAAMARGCFGTPGESGTRGVPAGNCLMPRA